MGVIFRLGHHQIGQILGQGVFQMIGLGQQHLAHPLSLGGGFGHRPTALARHQHMNIATDLGGGGQDIVGHPLEGLVVVFGNH